MISTFHQKQWQFLKTAFKEDQVPHALLFSGEKGVGKKEVALKFLRLLNCKKAFSKAELGKEGELCSSCQSVKSGSHPDLFEIEPQKGKIGIGQIRDLTENLSLKSYYQWKGAILNNAHSMTKPAQNCLLKTLEEPSGQTCLILISDRPHLLLGTILSRVQQLKFFATTSERIKTYLIEQGTESDLASEIAQFCWGKPQLALRLNSNPDLLKRRKKVIGEFRSLLNQEISFKLKQAKTWAEKEDLQKLLNICLNDLREQMLDLKDSERVGQVKDVIGNVERVRGLIESTNVNKRLAMEELFLRV